MRKKVYHHHVATVKGPAIKTKPKKIHWRAYFERKFIFLLIFGVCCYALEHYWHLYIAGKGGELALGTVLEHAFFGIPMEDS
jgi:hypothetical protein